MKDYTDLLQCISQWLVTMYFLCLVFICMGIIDAHDSMEAETPMKVNKGWSEQSKSWRSKVERV